MYEIRLMSVIAIGAISLVGFGLPIVSLLVLWRKFRGDLKLYFAGWLAAFAGSFLLMQILRNCLEVIPGAETIQATPWLYGLCIAVLTVLVEEGARLWVFRLNLKNTRENDYNAFVYAAGQIGLLTLVVVGIGMSGNYPIAVSMYQGRAEIWLENLSGDALVRAQEAFREIADKPVGELWSLALEPIATMAVHMALSAVMWFGCKERKIGWKLVGVTVGMRLIFEWVAEGLTAANLAPLAVQGVRLIMAALCWIPAVKVWKANHTEMPEEEPDDEAI